MSPDTLFFGRLTHNSKRINLGRAPANVIMTRGLTELHKLRRSDDMTIQIEMSTSKLPDSTTFDRQSILEHQLAANLITDPSADSPFPGITIGRVAEAMSSPEYAAYAAICEPVQRQGLSRNDCNQIAYTYCTAFPDCFPHFPKWID